jgi:peptide-methionine (S)-S-oxide reductase
MSTDPFLPPSPCIGRSLAGAVALAVLGLGTISTPATARPPFMGPPADATLVLAGGCFWGVEAVFEHVRGVRSVTSGYARDPSPARLPVPVEAVRVVYDPSEVALKDLLEVFVAVAHDPTSRDRQGPDAGPEYRAVAFYQTSTERELVEAYFADLTRARRYSRPIVTEIRALGTFTDAEPFHQNFAARNPMDPYVVVNDAPKLARLSRDFARLYREARAP